MQGSLSLVDKNLGSLVAFLSRSSKEFVPLRHKESGLGAGGSREPGDSFVVICVFLLNHVQSALSSHDVDTAASSVIENVIRSAGNLGTRDFLAPRAVEHDQTRGIPACNKQPMMRLVQRHR